MLIWRAIIMIEKIDLDTGEIIKNKKSRQNKDFV